MLTPQPNVLQIDCIVLRGCKSSLIRRTFKESKIGKNISIEALSWIHPTAPETTQHPARVRFIAMELMDFWVSVDEIAASAGDYGMRNRLDVVFMDSKLFMFKNAIMGFTNVICST